MAMERGTKISVKIPSQVEMLSKSLLDIYWSQYVLDELMYFWLVLLPKKIILDTQLGSRKNHTFLWSCESQS